MGLRSIATSPANLQDGARRHDRRKSARQESNSASSAPCTRSTAGTPTSSWCRKSRRGGFRNRAAASRRPRLAKERRRDRRSLRRAMIVACRVLCGAPHCGADVDSRDPFDSAPDVLEMPADVYLGEVAGVASNATGHLFVYPRPATRRSDWATHGCSATGARGCFEFDRERRVSCVRSAQGVRARSSRRRCASIRRTTSGSSTRGRTRWSSSAPTAGC